MSSKIVKSVSTIGAMTLLSRVSGLIRDVLFANLLGDKMAADVFLVAFRVPNFFRRIFAEGAFSAAFVPIFTEYRMHKTESESQQFLQLLLGRFTLILILFSMAGVFFAPALITVLAPGFLADPQKYELTVLATRITFPYLFFISLVAASAGMLNTCGRFAAPAATPVLLNISLILAALFFVPYFSHAPIALSVGVLLAGFVQLIFQYPFLKKEKLTIKPRLLAKEGDEIGNEGVKKVFKLILPAAFGVSVAQVNVLINTLLASFLVTGSISWLYYSDRLMEFPVGVFGIALSTAILPDLSRKYTDRSIQAFSGTLDWAARWVFLICIPSTVGLIVLSQPMIATIYYHGDFTANGVMMSSASLVAFSFGLTAIVMVKVLAPGFYARQNTKKPVQIGMIAVGINILMSLALVYPLKHVGLALATSIAAFCNAALLYFSLRKEKVYVPGKGWPLFFVKIVVAAAMMGAIIWWMKSEPEQWLTMSIWSRSAELSALIASGGSVYLVGLYLMGVDFASMWRSKGVES
ncbi:MAG: murein biosynthesis integral membrane protein MurJ [Gammaproteobacteria bacterium]|nr:murein biosynthesis integral membrane protein MurJ [Gammaproteobacteria bacterium]